MTVEIKIRNKDPREDAVVHVGEYGPDGKPVEGGLATRLKGGEGTTALVHPGQYVAVTESPPVESHEDHAAVAGDEHETEAEPEADSPDTTE